MVPTPLPPLPRPHIGDVFNFAGAGGGMLFYNLIPKGGAFAPPFDNPSRVIACCLRGSYPQTGVQGGVVPSEHRPGPTEPAGETRGWAL